VLEDILEANATSLWTIMYIDRGTFRELDGTMAPSRGAGVAGLPRALLRHT
jgi:hypothetical protein